MGGVGLHNSEYRRFNRSFGRGNPKPFQPSQRQRSPQQTRKGDLFVEAGRLAVEYLVSHGLLSSNVLSSKPQNGVMRNNSGEFQNHRSSQDREISSSRKSPNDQDLSMSRDSYSRERRRFGFSRSYSSEFNHENEKEGSLSDKATASGGMEAYDEKLPKDTSKDSRDVLESKMASVLENKDAEELPKPSSGVDAGFKEAKDGTSDLNKETSRDEMVVEHQEENNDTSKDCMDLLKLCPSAENPTEDHSSLTNKSPRNDPLMPGDGNNTSDTGFDSVKYTKDVTMNGSSEIASLNESAGALNPACTPGETKSVESLSFTNRTFSYERKSSGLPDLGSFSEHIGEKRPFEDENVGEGAKRAKQWLSVAPSDEYSQLSDLSEKQSISQANRTAPVNTFNDCANQGSFGNISLPMKGSVESTVEQGEEKQLFSSSFKICDLNLMGAPDMHENHVSGLLYPSISAPTKSAAVHVDLSMNNNYSLNSGYNDRGAPRKDIEIIDLEGASMPEVRSIDTSTRNMDGDITNMGSFQNNSQNCNDNPDGQDGYGFMISELLGNDAPNCSSVQPDMNSLNNDMGLHHGEGIFSEDDQIYMSLGEIPISMPDI